MFELLHLVSTPVQQLKVEPEGSQEYGSGFGWYLYIRFSITTELGDER